MINLILTFYLMVRVVDLKELSSRPGYPSRGQEQYAILLLVPHAGKFRNQFLSFSHCPSGSSLQNEPEWTRMESGRSQMPTPRMRNKTAFWTNPRVYTQQG